MTATAEMIWDVDVVGPADAGALELVRAVADTATAAEFRLSDVLGLVVRVTGDAPALARVAGWLEECHADYVRGY